MMNPTLQLQPQHKKQLLTEDMQSKYMLLKCKWDCDKKQWHSALEVLNW